jgi:hypothetical protein
LYILIWAYGVYLAATPILLKLQPDEGLITLRHGMDLLFDLGGFIALFFFLFRATHVLESHLAACRNCALTSLNRRRPIKPLTTGGRICSPIVSRASRGISEFAALHRDAIAGLSYTRSS